MKRRHCLEPLEPRIAPAGVSSIDLGALNGTNGFKVTGSNGSQVGTSIASAGDINGDGLDDVIIGGPVSPSVAYVVFGKKGGLPANLNLAQLNGTDGFRISPENNGDELGIAVGGAGDVNGDGYDDFLIGARSHSAGAGAVYVVYGRPGEFAPVFSLGGLNGINGTKIITSNGGDQLGSAVAGAGDVNGDGYADIVMAGANVRDQGVAFNGAAYVVFGKAGGLGANFSLTALNGTNGFKTVLNTGIPNLVGRSVAGGGDINGDGFDDVIISAQEAAEGGTKRGAAFVIYGKSMPYTASVNLANLTGAAGFRLSGVNDSARIGDSVANLGDVNNDGYADFAVGASSEGATQRGAVFVVFGRPGGFGSGLLTTDLDGVSGFRMNGALTGDFLSVTGGPVDFNGDGFADVLAASASATEVGSMSGATYVLYGRPGGFAASFSVAEINGANGLKLRGAAAGDFSGAAIAGGDFNGDGFGDVFVGAQNAGAGDSGAGYVAFGTGPKVTIAKTGRTATFVEADGDLVTVKISKGLLNRTDLLLDADGNLQKLSLLSDAGAFAGATVSVTAKKLPGGMGDGRANLGALDARGSDLLSVTVSGDLGQVDCGDANPLTPALGTLNVGSLGTLTSTQPSGTVDPLTSRIEGSVKTVKVARDMAGVLQVSGSLGSVRIGGNLDGDAAGTAAGLIRVNGNIGTAFVARDVLGGADFAGILSGGKLGSVTIGGSLLGTPSKPVHIAALGTLDPVSAADAVAIKSVNILGGSVHGRILAGYGTGLSALNGDAGIGKVSFGKLVAATSVAAGVADTTVAGNLASAPNGFGRNDTALGGGNADVVARIASIVLKVAPGGTFGAVDSFGFTAEQIGKVVIAGKPAALTANQDVIILNAPFNDLRIVEV